MDEHAKYTAPSMRAAVEVLKAAEHGDSPEACAETIEDEMSYLELLDMLQSAQKLLKASVLCEWGGNERGDYPVLSDRLEEKRVSWLRWCERTLKELTK